MKRSLLIVVLALFSTIVLAGCMRNVRKPQDFNILTIDDIKDKQTKISFMVRQGLVSEQLEIFKEEFEKEYNFIEVDIRTITGSYDQLRQDINMTINSKGDIPNLVMGYPDHFAEYFSGGNLLNMQFFIEDENVGYSKDEMADFLEVYLNENRGYDSKNPQDLYGLPFNKSTEVMVYNRTAFQALYGDDYQTKLPKTWAEVETLSKDIIEKVKDGKLDKTFVEKYDPATDTTTYLKVSDYLKDSNNIKFIPFAYDSSDNAFITLTRQFGGKYTERENVSKGYVLFDNPESRAAMEFFLNLRNKGYFGVASSFGLKYNSDAFKLIQVLMTIGSSAGVNYNGPKEYQYELGVAPIPYYSADKKIVIQQGTNIGMLNHGTDEQKLAAWLFLKFLLRPENTAKFAVGTGGYLPVRKSALNTEFYQAYLNDPSDDKVATAEGAKVALIKYQELGYQFFVDPAFRGSSTIRTEAGRVFDSIIVNGEAVAKRFADAYDTLYPYVKK